MAKKILVVEDDPSAQRRIKNTLGDSYQLVTASNGLEGVKKAREERPDLLILDVMLPGLDGFEVCRRLRADPITARLPILMMSAKSLEVDILTGLRQGADEYLCKPASPAEISSRVASLLAKQGAPPASGDGGALAALGLVAG